MIDFYRATTIKSSNSFVSSFRPDSLSDFIRRSISSCFRRDLNIEYFFTWHIREYGGEFIGVFYHDGSRKI